MSDPICLGHHMGASGRSDRLIAALAAPQHGVVSRQQLLATGVTRRQIAARLRSGLLHQMHPGAYAVGHRALTPEAVWAAAVLACREGATLSHRSAAALWRLARDGLFPAVTTSRGLRAPGIEHHRATLAPRDRTTHRGIAVTSVARTLADLAHVLDDDSLEQAVREAQFMGRWDEGGIRDVLSRRPSTRLAAYLGDIAPMQTRLERSFLSLCDRHRIPRPLTQQGRRPRLDFVWLQSVLSSRSTAGRRIARAWRSSRTARRRTHCSSTDSSCCGSPGRTSTAARRWSRRRSAGRSVSRAASPAAGSPAPPRRYRRDR